MHTSEPTVFVVDDDESVCDSLKLLLSSAGLSVRTFRRARDFLAAYEPDWPGCLVVDVLMPEMNGLELLGELVRKGYHLPTIVVTAHADVPMAVEAVKAGAMDFIEKPFSDETLLAGVRKAIDLDARARKAQSQ